MTISEHTPYGTVSFVPVREEATGWKSAAGLAGLTAMTYGVGALGGASTQKGVGLWYSLLRKPPYQPPRWIFAPVWGVLYGAIALSGWRAWKRHESPQRTISLGLWAAQLALNGAWSWLFFGKHRPRAALKDELALVGATTAYALTVRRVDRGAAALMLPYLGWLSFAALLNSEIVRLNPHIRG